jgi:hypothetical protein
MSAVATVECAGRPRRPRQRPRGVATPDARCSVPDATHETWLPVPGWEGLYEVSDLGRVRSLPHLVPSRNRWSPYLLPVRGCVLKTRIRHRYLAVVLVRQGTRLDMSVHRLVLSAFVGPCPPGQESRHGPGGALDNRLINLCYGTRVENAADRVRDGTNVHPGPSGEDNGNAKLTTAIVAECRECRVAGVTIAALARFHGVDASTMSVALSGKTWRQP